MTGNGNERGRGATGDRTTPTYFFGAGAGAAGRGAAGAGSLGAAAAGAAGRGAADAAAAGAGFAASKRRMTSVVRSRPGSAISTPASVALKRISSFFSLKTAWTIGPSFCWNSSCSSFWSSCTSFCASSVKRWMSVCWRSMSFSSCPRALSLSTLAPESSFCCDACSAEFFAFSSVTFWLLRACTRVLSALPCCDSAAMRWMLTNAYFAPAGNGASGAGAAWAASGGAGAAAGAWAKVGAAASTRLRAAATTKALITVNPFLSNGTGDFNMPGSRLAGPRPPYVGRVPPCHRCRGAADPATSGATDPASKVIDQQLVIRRTGDEADIVDPNAEVACRRGPAADARALRHVVVGNHDGAAGAVPGSEADAERHRVIGPRGVGAPNEKDRHVARIAHDERMRIRRILRERPRERLGLHRRRRCRPGRKKGVLLAAPGPQSRHGSQQQHTAEKSSHREGAPRRWNQRR